jgi:hypothetical protein
MKHKITYVDTTADDKVLDNIWAMLQGTLMLAMLADLVLTPEQREQWKRNYDWDYYASKYAD